MDKFELENGDSMNAEELQAILNIRNHALHAVNNTIYEDTTQLLSLVRVKLSIIENDVGENMRNSLQEVSEFAGVAIRQLREMSSRFYPEDKLKSETGLSDSLRDILKGYSSGEGTLTLIEEGIPRKLQLHLAVKLLSSVISILDQLNNSGQLLKALQIIYDQKDVVIALSCQGTIGINHLTSMKEKSSQVGVDIKVETNSSTYKIILTAGQDVS